MAASQPSPLVPLMTRVAGAAMLLRACVGEEGNALTDAQAEYASVKAGTELGGALTALDASLPAMRARATADPDVDAMLGELDAHIKVPDGPGDYRLYALAPVSAIAFCLLAQIERGQRDPDEVIWTRLDERLTVLEETNPAVYDRLARKRGAWFDAVRVRLPEEAKN